jgi:hypothetical protein
MIGLKFKEYGIKKKEDPHINILELLAIFISIRSFCKNMSNIHIKIFSNNSSAIAYLNNMSGIKSKKMNEIAKGIWFWCINRHIWISADYVSGKFNVVDAESRNFNDNTEWMLEVTVFN